VTDEAHAHTGSESARSVRIVVDAMGG